MIRTTANYCTSPQSSPVLRCDWPAKAAARTPIGPSGCQFLRGGAPEVTERYVRPFWARLVLAGAACFEPKWARPLPLACAVVNLFAIGRRAHELHRKPTPAYNRKHAPLPCCFAVDDGDWFSRSPCTVAYWSDSHDSLPFVGFRAMAHGHAPFISFTSYP